MGQAVNPGGFRVGFTKPWPVQTSDFYGRPDETHFRFSFFFWELGFYIAKLFGAVKKAARRLSAKSRQNSSYFSSYFKLFEYSHLRIVSFFKFIRVNIFFFQPSLLKRLAVLGNVISSVWKKGKIGGRRSSSDFFVKSSVTMLNAIIFNRARYRKVRRRGGSKLTRSQIYRKANRYVSSYRSSKFPAISPFLYFQPLLVFFRFLFFFYFGSFFKFMSRLVKKFSLPFLRWFKRTLKVTFFPLKHYWCHPTIVNRFFARKIRNRRSPLFLVQTIKRVFFSGVNRFYRGKPSVSLDDALPLAGFRVKIAGRWTRQQMAQLFKKTYGRVSNSTQTARIDHYYAPIRLKNSSVGVSISIQSPALARNSYAFTHASRATYRSLITPAFFKITPAIFSSTFSTARRRRILFNRVFSDSVFKDMRSYYDHFRLPSRSWSTLCLSGLFSIFQRQKYILAKLKVKKQQEFSGLPQNFSYPKLNSFKNLVSFVFNHGNPTR